MYYCYHCLLVPADLTLTTDTLTELFQSVEDPDPTEGPYVPPRPLGFPGYDIGGSLGLPESALAEIRKRYQSWAKRKEAYLDTYVHYHPCPSWKAIHELLGKCSLRQQAEEVKVTYVQGMHAVKHELFCGGGVLIFCVQTVKLRIYIRVLISLVCIAACTSTQYM